MHLILCEAIPLGVLCRQINLRGTLKTSTMKIFEVCSSRVATGRAHQGTYEPSCLKSVDSNMSLSTLYIGVVPASRCVLDPTLFRPCVHRCEGRGWGCGGRGRCSTRSARGASATLTNINFGTCGAELGHQRRTNQDGRISCRASTLIFPSLCHMSTAAS